MFGDAGRDIIAGRTGQSGGQGQKGDSGNPGKLLFVEEISFCVIKANHLSPNKVNISLYILFWE